MRLAICSGSFDPITKGHYDIILRASKLFDQVLVVIAENDSKQVTFSVDERIDFIKRSTHNIPNIDVDSFTGLLADYAREKNACAVVRGLRAVSDFEYEFQMSLINKKLNVNFETIFLNTASENMFLSSSIIKQIAKLGGDISDFVPSEVVDDIKKKFNPNA